MRDELKRSAIALCEAFNAASMPIGARVFANCAVDAAGISASDRVVDVGCGPGTASRISARRGATVFGVDPTPAMLRFARWLTRPPLRARITWYEGVAESIPLGDGDATVALAIRSAHHFDDPKAAFDEIHRVLQPGGRFVIVERAVGAKPRGRGHHGLTPDRARETAAEFETRGFDRAEVATRKATFGQLVVISAVRT